MERKEKWLLENPHSDRCYQTLVKTELKNNGWFDSEWGYLDAPKNMDYNKKRKIEDTIRKKYCEQLNLSYPRGSAVHCTCTHDKDYAIFVDNCIQKFYGGESGHVSWCPVIRPNFRHKQSGFEIQWYKYPLRDSYTNYKISLNEFRKIITDCINSLLHNR